MDEDRWQRLFSTVASLAPAADVLSPEAIRSRFGDRREWQVRSGQVWLAACDGVSALVYVVDVGAGLVTAAPVTLGTDIASAGSVVVDANRTVFADPLAVWLPSASQFSWGALDRLLDQWSKPIADWMSNNAIGEAPSGCHSQTDDAPLLSSVWDEFAETAADIHEISTQFPAPRSTEAEPADGLPLGKLPPSKIAQWLGVTIAEAQSLRRGHTHASPDQLTVIARETGQPVASVSTVPAELLIVASHPMYREDVSSLCARWGSGVADTQLRLAQGAYGLAARRSGGEGGRWEAQLDAFITSELSGPTGAQ